MRDYRNKVLLLFLSSIVTIDNILEFLPSIVNELIILILIVSFTIEYKKLLKIFYIKLADNLVFNSLLFIYAVIGVIFAKFFDKIEMERLAWLASIIVILPVLIMGLYGINYFKINSYELKQFYERFLMSKNEYNRFWDGYHKTHGIINKIVRILIKAIPGLLAGVSIVFLIFPIMTLIFTDYLFLILSLLLLMKEYLHKKKLIVDSNKDLFQFLRYFLSAKGVFGSAFLILGYMGWGILLISFINLSLAFLYEAKLGLQLKILLFLLLSIFYIMASYMFLYQYRLSKRFSKFIPLFYEDKEKITTLTYPSLPYGGDKIAILSLMLFFILNYYYLHFLLDKVKHASNGILYLAISSIAVLLICILYIFLIFSTFKDNKMEDKICDLKKDNLRIPFISTMPLIILCGMNILYGGDDIYGWLAVFYGIIFLTFSFNFEDLYRKFRKWRINEYIRECIVFSIFFSLVGLFILIPPIKKFYQMIVIAEIVILLVWIFDIIYIYNKNN